MEIHANSVKKLILDFKGLLGMYYSDNETMCIVYQLFEEYLGWPKTQVYLSYNDEIPEKEMHLFHQALNELQTGKPIQYILGWTSFNGIKLKVNSHVLVPRPETEELCSIIKSDFQQKSCQPVSILDIGTGSGCISIYLNKSLINTHVTGIDSSMDAVEMAIINARNNDCKINFLLSDILNPQDCSKLGLFDLIVSNPPYVLEKEKIFMHKNVLDFEPHDALFVPEDDPLLFYRVIASFALDHLKPEGRLYFEINENYGFMTNELVRSFGYEKVETLKDINGKDRFIRGTLKLI